MPIDFRKFDNEKITLIKKQDWLNCRKQLEALDNLFAECANEEEVGMLFKIISNFTCADEDAFWGFYSDQASKIISDETITVTNCIIGPTTYDDDPDSSQHVCNPFRNLLKRNGGNHVVKNHFTDLTP